MQVPGGVSMIGSLVGLAAVTTWRLREGRTSVSIKKIVIPPLGMASGFAMFLFPAFRIPWTWAAIAFLTGAIGLAYPLLLTSRLVRQGDVIIMKRSNLFIVIIITLAAIRIMAHAYFDTIFSAQQTATLFFVLAFGMILRWRIRMLLEYRALFRRSDSRKGDK